MAAKSFRAIVASGDLLIRSGLTLVLQAKLNVVEIIESNGLNDCLAKLSAAPADMVIMDRGLLGDMQALRKLRAACSGAQLALLVNGIDRNGITQLLEAGTDAIIPKQLPSEELVRALKYVCNGRGYLPQPTEAQEIRPHASNDHESVYPLTTRQYQVMRIAMSGKSNKEIAHILGIAESTVKIHMSAAFRALNARNRVGAFAKLNELEAGNTALSVAKRIDRRKGDRRKGDRRQAQADGWVVARRR